MLVRVRVRAWGSASSVLRARVNVQTKLRQHEADSNHYVDYARLVRKVSSDGARTTCDGNAFYILTVAGKNECRCASADDAGRWYLSW